MTGPSHEPLDEQERELARILRALPGAEPPAALDQRILRAAADAAASSRRRPAHRWLAFGGAGWGIGSAAAAVLALGVGWHLLDPARNLPTERSAPVAAPAEEDAISVGLGEPQAPAAELVAPTAPPASPRPAPAAAQPARPSLRRAPVEAPTFAPSPPPPPPMPAAAPVVAEPTMRGETAAMASAEAQAQQQEAMAGLVESRAREVEAERAERADAALAAKQQSKAADAAAANSGAMTPARWLAEVRRLRDANRRAEAADSLRRFHQYYPQYAIPADLLPLMRE